ncbi:MAG TPA: hypothetical protein VIK41_04920 [Gemmatimonadaceae bacterium]
MSNELRIPVGTVGAPTVLLAGPALELVHRWTTELQVLSPAIPQFRRR